MIPYSSFYEILNVPDNAGIEEIKAAFRRLALIHHPDKNNNSPESEADFRMIYNAYSVLTDPVKREEYNTYLRTSSALNIWRKGAHYGKRKRVSALPAMAGSPYGSPEAVFGRLNYLLWDIEDLLGRNNAITWNREKRNKVFIDWNREYGGMPFWRHILKILTFIDKWVLEPAGFRDYFMDARKLERIDPADYFKEDNFKEVNPAHRPFVSVSDYFYNIRKRMDSFMKHARAVDLVRALPECGLRLIDCIFEAENYTVHYMTCLNRALGGEAVEIPPFRHSNACFG